MEIHGPGPFDNESREIERFLDSVPRGEFRDVRRQFTRSLDEEEDCAIIYAAAAIIAASQGHAIDDLPIELSSSLYRLSKGSRPDYVQQAREAVESLKSDSALKRRWQESPSGTRPLTSAMNKLIAKLNSDPVELPSPPPRPRIRRLKVGDWFAIAVTPKKYAFSRILYLAKKTEFGSPAIVGHYEGLAAKPVLPDPHPGTLLMREAVLTDYFTKVDNDYEVIAVGNEPVSRDESRLQEYRDNDDNVLRNAKRIRKGTDADKVLPRITEIEFSPMWSLFRTHGLIPEGSDISKEIKWNQLQIARAHKNWEDVVSFANVLLEEKDARTNTDQALKRTALAYWYRAQALGKLGQKRRAKRDRDAAKALWPDVSKSAR